MCCVCVSSLICSERGLKLGAPFQETDQPIEVLVQCGNLICPVQFAVILEPQQPVGLLRGVPRIFSRGGSRKAKTQKKRKAIRRRCKKFPGPKNRKFWRAPRSMTEYYVTRKNASGFLPRELIANSHFSQLFFLKPSPTRGGGAPRLLGTPLGLLARHVVFLKVLLQVFSSGLRLTIYTRSSRGSSRKIS